MKKKILLFALVPLMASSLFSCVQNVDSGKVKIDYGRYYSVEPTEVEEISYDELDYSITTLKESFIVAISNQNCTCWSTFEPILNSFNYSNKYDIKHIYAQNFPKGKTSFGINVVPGNMPAIAIFKRGKLARQTNYSRNRNIFTKESELKKFIEANVVAPKMFNIDKTSYDALVATNNEFNLYVGRTGCDDCAAINGTLREWSDKKNSVNAPLYVFDIASYYPVDPGDKATQEQIDQYNADKETYQNLKDELGLSTKNNPDLGYSTGMVPTFQRKKGTEVKDMIVVLNDKATYGNYVLTSYFNSERVAKMAFLEGNRERYTLNGMIVPESAFEDFEYKGTVYKLFSRSYQLLLHKPIFELFFEAYVK